MMQTRTIHLGPLAIGGASPVSIQSMCNTDTGEVENSLQQIERLRALGCDIIRLAVPSAAVLPAFGQICDRSPMPVIADIHFDYRLALESVAAGADKIRVNPGNIGGEDRVKAVADACRAKNIPIRIGVNSGSVEKCLLEKYGGPTPRAMAESAMNHARLLEKYDFEDIVLSLKSSDVASTVEAYETAAELCDYPLHLGVTEAGTARMGLIKSSAGIGALLLRGIGDTIRVSLTDEPVREAAAGLNILKAVGLRTDSPVLVSCPTCGRTRIDIISLAGEVEKRLAGCKKKIKVAVMGCAVNGPGEAREADIGIAGGDGCGLIFSRGEILRKVPMNELADTLCALAERKAEG